MSHSGVQAATIPFDHTHRQKDVFVFFLQWHSLFKFSGIFSLKPHGCEDCEILEWGPSCFPPLPLPLTQWTIPENVTIHHTQCTLPSYFALDLVHCGPHEMHKIKFSHGRFFLDVWCCLWHQISVVTFGIIIDHHTLYVQEVTILDIRPHVMRIVSVVIL